MLARDWRAGELRVLVFALIIAVGGMTTVGFFADRVQLALSRQGNQLLGADLIIFSDHPLSPDYGEEAKRRGLDTSTAIKFPSMTARGDESLLTEIKAVTAGYPLRGDLTISEDFGNASPQTRVEHPARTIPVPGTAWVDEKLMVRLSLNQGDRIEVGMSRLVVTALITQEPDYSIGFLNLRPRVLINAVDLAATGLIQEGSRVGYRLMVAGNDTEVERFREWAQSRLMLGERIEGIRDARPEIKSALERAEKFLSLTALASVVLAAAAAALAVRRFTQRHLDGCAVMRCLGASQGAMLRLYLYHFIVLGLAASGFGCLLGFSAQEVLAYWLSGMVEAELPWPSIWPAVHGLLTGLVLLLGFALPPLLNLRSVPALRVLRRDIGPPNPSSLTGYALGVAVLSLLFLWKAGDVRLGASVIGGFIAAIGIFGLLGFLLVKMVAHMRSQTGGAWRYGLANIRRRATASVVQSVALGLGLMALLALTLIRDDLLRNWRTSLPPDAPNHFLVNIQPDQLQPMAEFFRERKMPQPVIFPMVRGRLTAINGAPIVSANYADLRAKRLVEREFNLSWTDELQSDNQIVKGRWWTHEDQGEAVLSLEEDIAKTIGIHLGDLLTYDVAGSTFSAKVTSFRKVNWDSFRVNFFVVTPPGLLDNYPASYITSFYLPPHQMEMTNQLVRDFPNLLVLDVATIISQVQKMIGQVTKAVEFVFLFTLLAGLAVLYAAIVSTQDERIYEAAVFRTLGANRRQLARAWAAEFAILGGLAGLFAAAGASALGYVVGEHALNLTYTFNPWIWVSGVITGMMGVTIAGLLGTRAALSTPPLMTLRKI